ncbi:O-acyltransferase WSD1-like [Quillaja saponaria]|uniref:O-acyltransferase WSD1-like n=1 Tax=Quillaja saponaria TaxID=32244 RepID=A0AAD7QHD5_QUISA|nr:O-acyltransferase WSD1-like [Quillaja saponaria]
MEYCKDEDQVEPVSPTGQYLNSSVLSIYILAVLETEVPVDDSQTISLLRDVFLPINSRFSSIMVSDRSGEKKWKQVRVKLEEHVKVPTFPTSMSSYDEYFDDYMSRIGMEQLPQNKPLWEIHLIKYPTSNAAGTIIFKLHHALGDGYSLMGALLSCLQRADDPSLPLTFPSSRRIAAEFDYKTIFSSVFNTISDFGWSVLKSSLVEDDQTPIRSGDAEVRFRPVTISTVSFSLEHIKEIKTKLGLSMNDVITALIFYGIRLYMQEININSSKSDSTALVLLNTRNIRGYESVKEMMKTDAKAAWGNRFAFLHVSIPKLNDTNISNPLEFVWEVHNIIKRKKDSLAISFTGRLLNMLKNFRGPEAAARYIHSTLKNSSATISNIIGPVEKMAVANLPVKGLYFMVVGPPESLTITIMSYMGNLRVAFGMEKGFINPQKFKSCMEFALEVISKAARDTPTKLD